MSLVHVPLGFRGVLEETGPRRRITEAQEDLLWDGDRNVIDEMFPGVFDLRRLYIVDPRHNVVYQDDDFPFVGTPEYRRFIDSYLASQPNAKYRT